MKIATWNVNSIRARVQRVLDVLERHDLDVLALQEIKCASDKFPVDVFAQAGYEVAAHGVDQWNGVAIISRIGLECVRTEFPRQPGFEKGAPSIEERSAGIAYIDTGVPEARALGAIVGASPTYPGLELWSLYVPNGRAIGDPHYYYKLDFLERLCAYAHERQGASERQGTAMPAVESEQKNSVVGVQESAVATAALSSVSVTTATAATRATNATPPAVGAELSDSRPLIFMGDWNVIPTDADVWARTELESDLYMTPAEREAFFAFESAGLRELSRPIVTNYTYWDYQRLRFPKNEGMRIDYVYGSQSLAEAVVSGKIDRDERKGKGASDHVPVILELDL